MTAPDFATVERSWPLEKIRIHLAVKQVDGSRVLLGPGGGESWVVAQEMTAPPAQYEPALTVSDSMARELYRALAAYFNDEAGDTRALRKDYDAERARVDKLIDSTIELAQIAQRG